MALSKSEIHSLKQLNHAIAPQRTSLGETAVIRTLRQLNTYNFQRLLTQADSIDAIVLLSCLLPMVYNHDSAIQF